MSFLNTVLLFGAGLAVIPVILHLLMRNKPKRLRFPALRLLQLRKKTNSRRMRLRHLWLLLLRILIILLIVLALARPTLPAANYALSLREKITLGILTVAAIAAYVLITKYWNRATLPGHIRRERSTLIKGGVGLGTFLLAVLIVFVPYALRVSEAWNDPQPPVQENFPVSAVLIYDVSPSMSYRQGGETRLDVARTYSDELIARLPVESQIAIGDSASDAPIVFQADATAANERLDSLELVDRTFSLDRRVRAAIRLQARDRERVLEAVSGGNDPAAADRFLREIYVFTDLARHAWRLSASKALREELEKHPWLAVYLVDVGDLAPKNVKLDIPRLSAETVSPLKPLIVRAGVESSGMPADQFDVELFIKDAGGEWVKKGTKSAKTSGETNGTVEFDLANLNPGLIEGELRLASSDPMPFDNKRYFTAEAIAAPRVLIVSDDRARSDLWATYLGAPEHTRYVTVVQPPSVLASFDPSAFDVVCMLSVEAPSERAWNRLEEFVASGKGLFVTLGTKRIDVASYKQSVSARKVLPGIPFAQVPFSPPELLDLEDRQHPLLDRLDELGGAGDLLGTRVFRRWKVDLTDGATVIAPYTNTAQDPALLEKTCGRGRVLMLTTSMMVGEWNELGVARLEFFILADLMMQSIDQMQNRRLNVLVGQSLTMPIPAGMAGAEFLQRTPALLQVPLKADPETSQLSTATAEQAGHYDVRKRDGGFQTGFSANISPEESDLEQLTLSELTNLFGEGHFGVARSLEELEPVVRDRRLGLEIVPFLVVLLMLIFAAEQFAANRFYDEEESPDDENDAIKSFTAPTQSGQRPLAADHRPNAPAATQPLPAKTDN